jgi:integrase
MRKTGRREFGSMRVLKSGKIQASFKMEGRTIYGPNAFLTKTEAKQWLSEQQYLLNFGDYKPKTDNTADTWLFGDYAMHYLELKTSSKGRALSPAYVAKCKQHLSGSLACFAGRALSSISKSDVDEWWADGLKSGKITSRSNAYRFLKAVLNKAIEDEVLQTRNPCRVKGAGSASTGVEIYTPSRDELRRLVAVSPIDFAAYSAISFSALLRFEEATSLTIGDLTRHSSPNGVRYKVSVTKSVARVDGEFILGPTKSEEGNRETFLPPEFNGLIEKYLSTLQSPQPSALLFPSVRGGTFMHNSVIQKQLHRYRAIAGLTQKGFTLHGLRRGGATAFSELGGTFAEVKDLLGDSSSEAAQRYVRSTQRKNELPNLLFKDGVSIEL